MEPNSQKLKHLRLNQLNFNFFIDKANCAEAVKTHWFSPRNWVICVHLMSSVVFGRGSLFVPCLSALEFKSSPCFLDHCNGGSFWPWLTGGPRFQFHGALIIQTQVKGVCCFRVSREHTLNWATLDLFQISNPFPSPPARLVLVSSPGRRGYSASFSCLPPSWAVMARLVV